MKEYRIAEFVAVRKNENNILEKQDFRILLEVDGSQYKPLLFLKGCIELLMKFNVKIDLERTELLEEKTREEAIIKFMNLYLPQNKID